MILIFASVAWEQEKCEAPILNVGDKWKYSDKSGKQGIQEVLAVENDIYVIRMGKETRGYDKSTMNVNFILEGGKRIKYTESRSRILNFPLFAGKKWNHLFSTIPKTAAKRVYEMSFREEYSVSGLEEVSTAAGKFKAYRIDYQQTVLQNMKQSAKGTYWYAPETKSLVKRIEEIGGMAMEMELVSCELK